MARAKVGELHEHARFGNRKKGVQKMPARFVQVHEDPRVGAAHGFEIERSRAVGGSLDIAEAVCLDDVAEFGVYHKAAHGQVGIEDQRVHGPSAGPQAFLYVLVGALFPGPHPVMDEGVVHVVADRPNRVEIERPIAKNPAPVFNCGHIKDKAPSRESREYLNITPCPTVFFDAGCKARFPVHPSLGGGGEGGADYPHVHRVHLPSGPVPGRIPSFM